MLKAVRSDKKKDNFFFSYFGFFGRILVGSFFIFNSNISFAQYNYAQNKYDAIFNEDKVGDIADLHPVENVTWEMVQKFLTTLNARDETYHYRLPTEFEWEYAARAGNDELLSWSETRNQAWIQQTDKGTSKPVGTKKPNPWGLYDMLGNVWEWVEDNCNNDVFAGPSPPSKGEVHVLKGGSLTSDVTNATYLFHGAGPGNGYDVGFRLVRENK